jgi:hypothetical protein
VYAWGRPELAEKGEHAARCAALDGVTSLWWRELLNRRPAPIQIYAPGRSASRPGILISHPSRIEREIHRGLPVVPLPRALLFATVALGPDSLRLVLARAEYRGILDLAALETVLVGAPRGTRALRAATSAHLPQLADCVNDFEREFVLLCERHRLPLPEPNPRIGRFRPDMLWRGAHVVVELDGRDAHHTAAQLAADARRQAELERLGFKVRRFSWAEVRFESDRVAAEIAPLLP